MNAPRPESEHADLLLIGTLIARTEWREGSIPARLKKVEKRARLRAAGKTYTADPALDRRLAKLARRVRKAMEDEHA